MKLEVGMYVRTNLGNIGKIVEEYTHQNYKVSYPEPQEWVLDTGYILNEAMMYENEEILKTSHNIIDLIEEGDYVNGHQVYEVDRECCRITLNGGSYGDEFRLTYLRPALGENMGIKSIVTKEQFEAIKYEVK